MHDLHRQLAVHEQGHNAQQCVTRHSLECQPETLNGVQRLVVACLLDHEVFHGIVELQSVVAVEAFITVHETQLRIACLHFECKQIFIAQPLKFFQGFLEVMNSSEELCRNLYSALVEFSVQSVLCFVRLKLQQ